MTFSALPLAFQLPAVFSILPSYHAATSTLLRWPQLHESHQLPLCATHAPCRYQDRWQPAQPSIWAWLASISPACCAVVLIPRMADCEAAIVRYLVHCSHAPLLMHHMLCRQPRDTPCHHRYPLPTVPQHAVSKLLLVPLPSAAASLPSLCCCVSTRSFPKQLQVPGRRADPDPPHGRLRGSHCLQLPGALWLPDRPAFGRAHAGQRTKRELQPRYHG